MSGPTWALMWVAATAPGVPATAPAAAVDWVELEVDGEAMTLSELLAQARWLVAWQRPEWVVDGELGQPQWRQLRQYVVDTILIAAQARRLASEEPTEAQLEQQLAALPRPPPPAPPGSVAAQALSRHLKNGRYLNERLRLAELGRGPVRHWLGEHEAVLADFLRELRFGTQVRMRGASGSLSQ